MKVQLGKYRKDGTCIDKVEIEPWDTWNLDTSLAKVIYPALQKFRLKIGNVPPNLTMEEWEDTLDAMIATFRKYATGEIEDDYVADSPREVKRRVAETAKGLMLFGKYYGYLWY